MRLSLLSAGLLFGLIGAVVHKQMHLESERNKPFHLGGSQLIPALKALPKPAEQKPQINAPKEAEEEPKKREIKRRRPTLPA